MFLTTQAEVYCLRLEPVRGFHCVGGAALIQGIQFIILIKPPCHNFLPCKYFGVWWIFHCLFFVLSLLMCLRGQTCNWFKLIPISVALPQECLTLHRAQVIPWEQGKYCVYCRPLPLAHPLMVQQAPWQGRGYTAPFCLHWGPCWGVLPLQGTQGGRFCQHQHISLCLSLKSRSAFKTQCFSLWRYRQEPFLPVSRNWCEEHAQADRLHLLCPASVGLAI